MKDAASAENESIYSRQLEMGFVHLRFHNRLEKQFRAETMLAGLWQLRVALTIGFLFGLSVAAFDYFYAGPGFSHPSVPHRAMVNQPLLLLMILATFFEIGRRCLTPMGMIIGLVIPGGSFVFSTVAEAQGIGTALAGQLVATFYVYFFLGLRFWPAFATAATILIMFFAVAISSNAPTVAIFYSGMFMLFTNIIGAVGLYNLEYSRRESFLEARQLEYIASLDPLTRIANRKAFSERYDMAWAHCAREREPLLIALIDIDFFKTYNDTSGHQAGDRCLVQVAQTLAETGKRPLDLTARFGGEEFVILLPGCTIEDGRRLIDDARMRIKALGIPHPASSAGAVVTVSAGLAHAFPGRSERSAQGLLQRADEALYSAKEQGRNCVVAANTDDADATQTGIFSIPADLDPVSAA